MLRALSIGAVLSLILVAVLEFVVPAQAADPSPQMVRVEAMQFAYSPGVIRVPQGATVHIELASHDVTHGFLLEGYDVSLAAVPGKPVSAQFVASRPGRYRYY